MAILNEKDINRILLGIFHGSINVRNMPKKLYDATVKKLMQGLNEGYGKKSFEPDLYEELRTNIHVFSGAKTYTQVKDISSLILKGKEIRPWSEFKTLAREKYDQYNVNWLQAEYDTAIGQSQSAVKWKQIVRDEKPTQLLQRKAVMDANTSAECEKLNNLIAPANHRIWAERSPLTHFRCRCIITVVDGKASSERDISEAIAETDHIDPLFKGNPGIDRVVFNKSHPYFSIDKADREFAKKNFGLSL